MIVCHFEWKMTDGTGGSRTVMDLNDGLTDAIKKLLDYDCAKISIEKYNTDLPITQETNGCVEK